MIVPSSYRYEAGVLQVGWNARLAYSEAKKGGGRALVMRRREGVGWKGRLQAAAPDVFKPQHHSLPADAEIAHVTWYLQSHSVQLAGAPAGIKQGGWGSAAGCIAISPGSNLSCWPERCRDADLAVCVAAPAMSRTHAGRGHMTKLLVASISKEGVLGLTSTPRCCRSLL